MGVPGPYPQAQDSHPDDGVREGSGSGPVWAGIFLVVYIILGGLPTYFIVLLTVGFSGQLDGTAWFVVIAYVVPLIGAIALLVRAANRSNYPGQNVGYGYSTLCSVGGLFAMLVIIVGILA